MSYTTSVRSLMSTQLVAVDATAPASEVRTILQDFSFHHVPVVDKGVLVGIVSVLDVARVSLGAWVDADSEKAWMDAQFKVADIMSWEPEFVRDTDTVRHAADKLSSGGFHSLPVLDASDRLVGIVTSTDLLRYMAAA
ncbi:MAG: CBS domain-containing protein [Deltaproteobacteria bacterium]|nr:MAG: CBS domain-containing protein [Deltaproteobacteria bacterium]